MIYITIAFLVTASVIFAILYSILLRTIYYYKFRKAGGVKTPDFIGVNPINTLKWMYLVGKAQSDNRIPEIFDHIISQYATPSIPGTVAVNPMGSRRYFFTHEPEHMKAMLTSKFADYGKGPEFHRIWSPLLGDSIFTTDGKQWQESRSMLRPMFIKNRVSDLHIFERRMQIMLARIPSDGQTFDIQSLYYQMTIDVITEFLLGESTDSLRSPNAEFVQAFTTAQRWQILLTVLSPVEFAIPQKPYKDAIKVIESFMLPIIHRALNLSDAELQNLTKSDSGFTFLHAIVQHSRDPKVIRDQIIAVLLAGRDTTASTLSWATAELARSPAAWAKLRQEVLSIIGSDRRPTYDDLKNMKYLNNVLNETLRLYPAVPFNVRAALQDTTLPSVVAGQPDLTVVAGDLIVYSPLSMQRRRDIFGHTSEKFASVDTFFPERWQEWQPKPWTYIPFNGGPRICVGQQFALVEMAYALARMAQHFDRLDYRGIPWDKQYHKVEIVGAPGDNIKIAVYATSP